MGRSSFQYYLCDDIGLKADILRAALISEAESYSLDVYFLNNSGQLRCETTAARLVVPKGAMHGASYGLAAALGAALASTLFLPLLYSLGQLVFTSLVFCGAIIGAWAGGAFMRLAVPVELRRRVKELQEGQLLLVAQADSHGHEIVAQALARYSRVVPVDTLEQTEH